MGLKRSGTENEDLANRYGPPHGSAQVIDQDLELRGRNP
jgi:hypothetical protein